MSYLVLARKWRPQRFEDVVGQRHVSLTLANAIKAGRLSHAFLFTGPRGIGKTSMARILAKAHNCADGPTAEPCNECDACRAVTDGHCLDVLEIDGASNRGIDDIRQLRESVKYAPSSVRTKVYIIDEVHMLTTDAFNALLKTLEEPPQHVCFIMATTEPLKVPATILSRCQRFDFSRLSATDLTAHLRRIAGLEKLEIDDEGLQLLASKAEGSVRDSLTLLDQIAATGSGPFSAARIREILGISGSKLHFEISAAVAAGDAPGCLRLVQDAYSSGLNLQEIAEQLVQHFRNLLLCALGKEMAELIEVTTDEREQLKSQAQAVRSADALRWLRILLDVSARMRRSPHGRVHLEVALVEMATLPRAVDLGSLLARLRSGEAASGAGGGAHPVASGGRVSEAPPAARGSAAAGGGARSTAGAIKTGQPVGEMNVAWAQVIERVRMEKAFLGSCLHESRMTGFSDGRMQIALADANGFKRDQVEKPANRRLILRTIEEVVGRPVGLQIVTGAGAAVRRPEPAREPDPAANRAQQIADIMGGDIVGPAP